MVWAVGMGNGVARGFRRRDREVGALFRRAERVFLKVRVGWIELLAGRKANAVECVRRKSPWASS